MPYGQELAARVREALGAQSDLQEKKMFGGLAFMLRGHMCCGILGDTLMVRVGSEAHEAALSLPHARPMAFTGKPMRGFLFVDPQGVTSTAGLQAWLDRALQYNSTLPAK